jgi:hypothetical protein
MPTLDLFISILGFKIHLLHPIRQVKEIVKMLKGGKQ